MLWDQISTNLWLSILAHTQIRLFQIPLFDTSLTFLSALLAFVCSLFLPQFACIFLSKFSLKGHLFLFCYKTFIILGLVCIDPQVICFWQENLTRVVLFLEVAFVICVFVVHMIQPMDLNILLTFRDLQSLLYHRTEMLQLQSHWVNSLSQ